MKHSSDKGGDHYLNFTGTVTHVKHNKSLGSIEIGFDEQASQYIDDLGMPAETIDTWKGKQAEILVDLSKKYIVAIFTIENGKRQLLYDNNKSDDDLAKEREAYFSDGVAFEHCVTKFNKLPRKLLAQYDIPKPGDVPSNVYAFAQSCAWNAITDIGTLLGYAGTPLSRWPNRVFKDAIDILNDDPTNPQAAKIIQESYLTYWKFGKYLTPEEKGIHTLQNFITLIRDMFNRESID